ncbi:DUF5994 family protein [Streptomyces sp. NPDC088551]|uniref:DUF5994 family protein n=1 Tax=Streptomyces sp. NPDC088551 TaxID=3365863 RepID=UPI003800B418
MKTTIDLNTSGTTELPAPSGDRVQPARLTLAPGAHGTGAFDGVWWPRSRDLARELPALAVAMDLPWGRITNVLVNPTHWAAVPRKVQLPDRMLHVGWFAEQDPHKLILRSYTTGRWDLLVIPPETSPAMAARLMARAAGPDSVLSASALIATERERDGE